MAWAWGNSPTQQPLGASHVALGGGGCNVDNENTGGTIETTAGDAAKGVAEDATI